ncbi:Protocadherin Fat 4 [Exaiptasia diaphana]|nr:Protocadherin Fat 4 [Exaiptasia diaphana]
MKVVWNGFLRKKIRGGCKRKDALDSKKRKNNNTAATADPVDWSFEISNRQLLNITKAHPKQHLKYLAHSACSSSPCVKNATCEGDFEDDPFPYRCVCPAGFTGQACQIDIDECTSNGACHVNAQCTNTPGGFNCTCKRGFFGDGKICHVARSCKGIKDLGYSRGDGEYWVDPENTGQPFIVYCDMTTDSGQLYRGYHMGA